MRKLSSIVQATALEILSEPLTLLVKLTALALVVFAPTFHYHQFGEVTRMARDTGFSAVLVGGGVLAAFETIRALRREIESGTLEMALARPVSRGAFFLGKALGSWLATVFAVLVVFATSLVVVEGSAVGGRIAEKTGDVARIWGPCVAVAVAVIVLPTVAAAALNRFCRCRFVLTEQFLSAALAFVAGAWAVFRDPSVLAPYFAALVPLLVLMAVWVAAAAAFAFGLRANAAAAMTGLVAAGSFPFVGNYYLSDMLANGGTVAWTYVAFAVLAALPAMAAFLLLGSCACEAGARRE